MPGVMPIRDLYGIFGHPVLHSRSPELFCRYFRKYHLDADYLRIDAVKPEDIMVFVKELGLKGFNITAPLKISVIPFLDRLDEPATRINAVNLVKVEDNRLTGFNTDYLGVIESLKGISLSRRRVIIIGSGGASRAACHAICSAGAGDVTILCRSAEKIKDLVRLYGCNVLGLKCLRDALDSSDLLINCLPSGINIVPVEYLRSDLIVFDANYYRSQLVNNARKMGCSIIEGYKWLYFQFIKSFELLFGLKVDEAYPGFPAGSLCDKKPLGIIGFMGTGKTLTAQCIAEKRGLEVFDTDREIERLSGMKIEKIFSEKGEKAFRDLESSVISDISFSNDTVYSFGGGSVQNSANSELIRSNCNIVLLWSLMKTVINRIKNSSRPLFEIKDPVAGLKDLLSSRLASYLKSADFLMLNETDIGHISERIVENIAFRD